MSKLLTAVILLSLSSCYVFKAYKYRKFELKDLDQFDAIALPPSQAPFSFEYDTMQHAKLKQYLDDNLAASHTYAFLVIKNDTIIYERYFGEVMETTKLPSFSVAKSFVSTLVGIALHEGHIKSLSEPVTNYLPELLKSDKRFANVSVQHVLDMRSGVKSSENYTNPFSDVLKMGFANNVSKPALKADIESDAGQFEYKSVNTQFLALIVEKATGRKLQDYAMEKLWKPLDMEYMATWNIDKKNTVRAFCCINAAARDYAKFGRLFLNKGNWNGKQVVPQEWVNASVNSDTMLKYEGYKNQWWAQRKYYSFEDSATALAFEKNNEAARLMPQNSKGSKYAVKHYDGSFYAQGILASLYMFILKRI